MLLTDCVFVHSVTGEETPFLFPVGAEELHDVTGQQALKKMLQARPNFEWYCWRYFYRRAYLIENELDFPVGATFEDVLFTSKALIMAQLIDYMPAVGLRYTNFRKGSIVNSMYLKKVQDKLFISRSACAFDVAHVKDPELLAMLLSNHAEYYIGAFRNYCECVPEAYPYLKECVYLAKYSKTRFGKMVYLATKFLGFRLGSLVAKQLFRILGLDK
jgi:hypothetical protein